MVKKGERPCPKVTIIGNTSWGNTLAALLSSRGAAAARDIPAPRVTPIMAPTVPTEVRISLCLFCSFLISESRLEMAS